MARYGFGPAVYPGYLEGRFANERLLAAELQNQQEQDIRRASLASIADASGADPTLATLMALSGGGQQQPTGFGPQPSAPTFQQQTPPPASAGRPADSSYMDPSGMQPLPVAPTGVSPTSGGANMPAPTGAAMPPGQPLNGVQPQARPPGTPPLATMPGGQMSLGQMFQRLRSDPRNQGIPDATLFQFAQKAQQAMFPADRALLQYMLGQDRIGAQMRGQDLTAAYRDAMAAIAQQKADQPNMNFIPGMGQGPDGKPTFGIYRVDKKTGNIGFQATGGAVGAPAVAKANSGLTFSPEMGALMAAMAEKGVSLPTGFRSKDQQAAMYKALLDRNPGKSADEIADMVKTGKIELSALMKETQAAATQAGRVQVAAHEIEEFTPIIKEISDKVPRGKFVPLNKLVQMGDESISDPNLRELKIRINSVLNAYDQLAARGGTDKDKRAEVRHLLLSADSPEVLNAALNSFQIEAQAALRAARAATKVPTEGGGSQSGGPEGNDPLGIR